MFVQDHFNAKAHHAVNYLHSYNFTSKKTKIISWFELHAGHFNAKALPSAGILPFAQSFICGMMNGCRKGTTFSEQAKNVDVYQDAG